MACPVTVAIGLMAGMTPAHAEAPKKAEAPRKHVSGRVLVKFRPDVVPNSAREHDVLSATGTSVIERMDNIGVSILRTPLNAKEETHVAMLKNRPEIEFAELDEIIDPASTPNDPNYANQWHLPKISAPAAWDTSVGSSSVIIAILDTGVDGTHPDLAPNMVAGWNVWDNDANTSDVTGHGTAVAGAAAAVGNNGQGCAAPAWNCRIMPIRIASTTGCTVYSVVASGLAWAQAHGARVANLSYGLTESNTVGAAAQNFQNAGGIVTVSSGNQGTFSSASDSPFMLTVSATDADDTIPSWSNTGNNIDLAAPGVSIYTSLSGGLYGAASGTSFSAPLVAGVAGLMFSVNPGLTGQQVSDMLKQAGDDLGPAGWDAGYGAGRLNAARAITLALSGSTPTLPTADTTAPTVAITSPTANATIGNSVTIAAGASDNVGVTKVEFYIDGALKGTDTSSPFSYSWSSRKATHGAHILQCKAYDAAGNMGASAGITVMK